MIGHEYVGVVTEVGSGWCGVAVGDFVVGGFTTSDNLCPVCRKGAHANCLNRTGYDGCQAELIRVQNADGTLLATPSRPDDDLVPSLLALSDVACTGWHGRCRRGSGRGRPWWSSATAQSGCRRCWPRRSWAR